MLPDSSLFLPGTIDLPLIFFLNTNFVEFDIGFFNLTGCSININFYFVAVDGLNIKLVGCITFETYLSLRANHFPGMKSQCGFFGCSVRDFCQLFKQGIVFTDFPFDFCNKAFLGVAFYIVGFAIGFGFNIKLINRVITLHFEL